jgi:hypothetical protein
VPKAVCVPIFGDAAEKNGLVALLSRLLLGWYVREIRRVDTPEDPGEAIVTYPLA